MGNSSKCYHSGARPKETAVSISIPGVSYGDDRKPKKPVLERANKPAMTALFLELYGLDLCTGPHGVLAIRPSRFYHPSIKRLSPEPGSGVKCTFFSVMKQLAAGVLE